jgi:hypothetical protein
MTRVYVAADHGLDVSPMIDALKFQPSDFELSGGWLVHVPSWHRFRFDRQGSVSIDAHCGCAAFRARRDQESDLKNAFDRWRADYWRLVETDREFASHFAPVGRLRRFARDVRMAFRRMRQRAPREQTYPTPYPAPAE